MNINKPPFRANFKNAEFLEDEIHIHFHLRRNWNESDVTGKIILRFDDLKHLSFYDRRDRNGVYINDKAGSFSFYEIQIPQLSKNIVVVFRNLWAGQNDDYGDAAYPHDEIVGVFKQEGFDSIRVKYDKNWILQPDDKLTVYPIYYSISYEDID